jgi:hypothetical protein
MPLTPQEFNKLVTKDDLKELEKKLASKDDINKVLSAVDGIAKKHKDFSTELKSNQGAHDRFEKRFLKIEQRLKMLEKKVDSKVR